MTLTRERPPDAGDPNKSQMLAAFYKRVSQLPEADRPAARRGCYAARGIVQILLPNYCP